MAKKLSSTQMRIQLGGGRRGGRFDKWLDGSIWELVSSDFAGRYHVKTNKEILKRARRSVVSRAHTRGLRIWVQRLSDGSLVIQASSERLL